ncbi:hypothetical protein J7I98_14560 [Streptomyces sp. ISL-98]|nr:hypothetical protein [Streptomyces sp. ISL-98]
MAKACGGTSLRRLPWDTPDGKPCFLSAESDGVMSQIADEIEEAQMATGEEVLGEAKAVLAESQTGVEELRFTLVRATESLRGVLRIAESRGKRLPEPEYDQPADGHGDDDGPLLPAEAFG